MQQLGRFSQGGHVVTLETGHRKRRGRAKRTACRPARSVVSVLIGTTESNAPCGSAVMPATSVSSSICGSRIVQQIE
jgi:hypothetical protein